MKGRFYIWILMIASFFSCKSIEKMVEKGEYDKAILFAAEKLQGDVDKETKYVVALEDAFAKVMQKDLYNIEHLVDNGRKEHYGRIYDLYKKIETRQKRITPFLPLMSEDGYAATFKMMDVRPFLREYAEKDSEYHYRMAEDLLNAYAPDEKGKAREAYRALSAITKYYHGFREIDELMRQARDLGTEHVLVTTDVNNNIYLDRGHLEVLEQFELPNDDTWLIYHNRFDPDFTYDYEAIFRVEHVRIDREREVVNHYVREKSIQDGFQYVLDVNGNVAKDTLGNDIKEPRLITVKAHITEVTRTKQAEVNGVVEIYDLHKDRKIDQQVIATPVIFEGFSRFFKGDRRAMNDRTLARMDNYLEPYPTDATMIYEGLENLKRKAKLKLKRVFS